ncbi:hypothetical protein ACHAWO_003485 [Cyclotella atomus]|uniref:Tic22-like protein n=1 Tax=Cyclotella atomus TaxID=382360 RepID=A0ABD3PHQ4_9STRA
MRSSTVLISAILQSAFAPTDGFLQLPRSAVPVLSSHHRQSSPVENNLKSPLVLLSTEGKDEIINESETAEEDSPEPKLTIPTRTTTSISNDTNDNNGPGLIAGIFAAGVLLFFAASAILPLIEAVSTAPTANSNLGNSVVTRQDGPTVKKYESKFDALSKTKIQEKLSNLPVFYLVNDGIMSDNIYFSFNEAESAAKDASATVKVSTLDQVLYPLILKQGKVKTAAPTPAAIKEAIETVSERRFTLVPSSSALKDAKKTGTTLQQNDVPLFIVERLAFASDSGAQVPLFLEKSDAILSYNRLRSSSNTLPESPTVRTSSLMDVLDSMERGTRQGTSQLAFYGNADDVLKADEMTP